MQKLKLVAALLLSILTGLSLPLGWLSMATRLHAQTTEQVPVLPKGMHSILESEPATNESSDAGRESGRDVNGKNDGEGDGEGDGKNDAERRATLKSENSSKVDVRSETEAELPQPADLEETLPAPQPLPQVSNSQSSKLQPSEPPHFDWPMLPTKLGYDVLLASPVHEALISTGEVERSQTQSLPVSVAPPDPIREQPARPAADSPSGAEPASAAEWIGGYWAWLPELRNYVWVSGLQRMPPPGRVWIAGSWNHSAAGYQWLAGYWDVADGTAGTNQTTTNAASSISKSPAPAHAGSVLPAPPADRDGGPTNPPPNADSFWIPGYWAARENWQNKGAGAGDADAYQWRDGYWTQHVDQWIWVSARVVAARDGYRYISGYWDYEPQHRGQGYAAVVFHPKTLDDSNYNFEPLYPLSRASALLLHLFVQTDRDKLYYGDLYDDAQVALGYRPWYLPYERQTAAPLKLADSDAYFSPPLLDYYQWKYHSAGIDFIASMVRYAQHFRSAPSIRPAAQTDKQPELAIREGLAGRVNASSFEQIVLGNVGGRGPLSLDGSPAPADIASQLSNAGNDAAVTQASATVRAKMPLENRRLAPNSDAANTSLDSGAVAEGAQQLPRGAAAIGQRGSATMLVLPGGRVVLAPPGLVPPSLPVGPNGAVLAPPAFQLPPGPLSGLRARFGRR